MEGRITKIEKEILELKQRNSKVEAEKAWEVSSSRKVALIILTYILTSVVFYFIGVEEYLLNALIPTLGYFVSTWSINLFKNYWLNKH